MSSNRDALFKLFHSDSIVNNILVESTMCGDPFSVVYSNSKTKNGDFPYDVNNFAN